VKGALRQPVAHAEGVEISFVRLHDVQDSDVTMAVYRENYGANFGRFVALKAKYDPNNLFRLNANVPPKIG